MNVGAAAEFIANNYATHAANGNGTAEAAAHNYNAHAANDTPEADAATDNYTVHAANDNTGLFAPANTYNTDASNHTDDTWLDNLALPHLNATAQAHEQEQEGAFDLFEEDWVGAKERIRKAARTTEGEEGFLWMHAHRAYKTLP
eukprot:2300368-Rhodomonas_salina.2